MKKNHFVKREITVSTSAIQAYDFLRFLKNQELFNKWAKTDSKRIVETTGEDGEVGFIYSWSGDKSVGEGAKEIVNLIEGKLIETEIRFIKPFKTTANIIMEIDQISENQIIIYFINKGRINYPLNILIPMAEKNFAKDMDVSLATLRELLEK